MGGEVILEHHQVVFIKFKIPRDGGGDSLVWDCDPRLTRHQMDQLDAEAAQFEELEREDPLPEVPDEDPTLEGD